VGLLAGCAAPATTAPAPTQSPPTQPPPTSTPGIPVQQVTIPVENESFEATVTGNGETAVLITDSGTGAISDWAPLVDALKTNRNLRVVTFAYRDMTSTAVKDVTAVLDYLRAEGTEKIICLGAGIGSRFCTNLQQEPEMIGMVLIGADGLAINADFPKLLVTADADPLQMAGPTERVYNQSAEPKTFKSYAAGVHGPALFKADVGPQVLADIASFINEIVDQQ
jgi:hypothetical protein